MKNIIEKLREAYINNKAEALNLLPELFKQYDDGSIPVLPCKVGGTIYVIPSQINYNLNILNGYKEDNRVYKQVVEEIKLFKNNDYVLYTCNGMLS